MATRYRDDCGCCIAGDDCDGGGGAASRALSEQPTTTPNSTNATNRGARRPRASLMVQHVAVASITVNVGDTPRATTLARHHPTEGARIGGLDGLRAVAVLAVV